MCCPMSLRSLPGRFLLLGLFLGMLGACTPRQAPQVPLTSEVQNLEREARQGDLDAQFFLGEFYKQGYQVPQDYAKAAYWYSQAAAQGMPKAQNNLGLLYEHGQGVPQDYAAAQRLYQTAAQQGFT